MVFLNFSLFSLNRIKKGFEKSGLFLLAFIDQLKNHVVKRQSRMKKSQILIFKTKQNMYRV
jgi:hypothetical protein